MMNDSTRTILLVVHPGRGGATDTARRVGKALGESGIRLRLLAPEASQLQNRNFLSCLLLVQLTFQLVLILSVVLN